jgi:putative transposase
VIAAHRHTVAANPAKVAALRALFPEFRPAMGQLTAMSRRELLAGQQLVHWPVMPNHQVGFPTELSARQLKSAQNMVHANLSGWLVRVQDRVRELVTGSNLPEHHKTLLYRINARKAWWVPTLELPWVIDGERLVPVEHTPPRQDTRGGVDCRGARDVETGAPASTAAVDRGWGVLGVSALVRAVTAALFGVCEYI